MTLRRSSISREATYPTSEWRENILSRRSFLLRMAGGSLAALMPIGAQGGNSEELTEARRWQVLDAVQNHLFPSEPSSPGARDIQALDYLRFVVRDNGLDVDERLFIFQGVGWLEDLTHKEIGRGFTELNEDERERMLRKVASSTAGENWLSTIQLYLVEALLADPVYGGNPSGIGWKWLGHNPGFPRPTAQTRYGAT